MTTTDQTARDVIAGMLSQVPSPIGAVQCGDPCSPDHWPSAVPWEHLTDTIAHHLGESLAAAGYAVVRLPEPNRFPGGEVEWAVADPDMFGFVNVNGEALEVNVGDERISVDASFTTLEGIVPTLAAARALAAALLAAADHQEKSP